MFFLGDDVDVCGVVLIAGVVCNSAFCPLWVVCRVERYGFQCI